MLSNLSPQQRHIGACLGYFVGLHLGHALQNQTISLTQLQQITNSSNGTKLQLTTPSDALFAQRMWDEFHQHERPLTQLLPYRDWFLQTYQIHDPSFGPQSSNVYQALSQNKPPHIAAIQTWENSQCQAAGSSMLKRTLPLGLIAYENPKAMNKETLTLCQLTHPDPRCVDSALFANRLLQGLLQGRWSQHLDSSKYLVGTYATVEQALRIAAQLPLASLSTQGYIITTLQASYRTLLSTQDFAKGLLELFSLGGRSSSLGALTGTWLGALLGPQAIPNSWLQSIPHPFSSLLPPSQTEERTTKSIS